MDLLPGLKLPMSREKGPDPETSLSDIMQRLHDRLSGAPRAGLADPDDVVQDDGGDDVEADVRPPDAEVAPSLIPRDPIAGEELVGRGERAVLAARGRVWIVERAWGSALEIRSEVFRAGLTGQRIEDRQFVLGAADLASGYRGRGEAADGVSQGRNAPHEQPKPWEGVGRLQNAVESESQGEQSRCDAAGRFCVG